MNRFAALQCTSRAKLVAPALNCLVPRFGEKMVKFPKNKLNNYFLNFGFLRGVNRFVPHWFICTFYFLFFTLVFSILLLVFSFLLFFQFTVHIEDYNFYPALFEASYQAHFRRLYAGGGGVNSCHANLEQVDAFFGKFIIFW